MNNLVDSYPQAGSSMMESLASLLPSSSGKQNKIIYSYFEEVCRKKCMRQSQKVLWVDLSSLFFKEIRKKGTRGHGHMFVIVKGEQQK